MRIAHKLKPESSLQAGSSGSSPGSQLALHVPSLQVASCFVMLHLGWRTLQCSTRGIDTAEIRHR